MRFSKIPGEDPSQIAFSPKIGNLHRVIIGKLRRVTICRELMHADQIVESEHVVTDRVAFWQCLGAKVRTRGEPKMIPRPVQHGGGVAIRLRPHIGRMMGGSASLMPRTRPIVPVESSRRNSASWFMIVVGGSRHLGRKLVPRPSWRWRQWRSVTICRELIHSDQINKSEHGETDRRQKNRKNYARAFTATGSPK